MPHTHETSIHALLNTYYVLSAKCLTFIVSPQSCGFTKNLEGIVSILQVKNKGPENLGNHPVTQDQKELRATFQGPAFLTGKSRHLSFAILWLTNTSTDTGTGVTV